MNDQRIDRHSSVIAIGGGAMLDVVGFAAAITHRGVRLIRMPTTVLAQNDAGIGVKNGVNYLGKKNFLGSFAPPFAVINDFTLLYTLRPQQWRDGTAEAVKVALIRDRAFFEWIEANAARLVERDSTAFRFLIRRCAELHLEHITAGGDPFERGSARPLDFGHWSAHKMESLSQFRFESRPRGGRGNGDRHDLCGTSENMRCVGRPSHDRSIAIAAISAFDRQRLRP